MENDKVETTEILETPEKIYASVDELVADGASEVEYAWVEGFKPGTKIRIGSVTAGEMMLWSEANEGEAKKSAGLRLITKSLVDKDGKRYADDPKNIAKFREMRHKETERIVKEIIKLNGMNVKDQADVKKD